MASLSTFLKGIRASFLEWQTLVSSAAQQAPACTIYIGNSSADLDSVASSICMAWAANRSLLQGGSEALNSNTESSSAAPLSIPLINCRRESLPLRQDIVYCFETFLDTSLQDMLTLDDVDLQKLATSPQTSLVLCDHNVLSPSQDFLLKKVTGCVDHHAIEDGSVLNVANGLKFQTVEPVGSCSSLVASLMALQSESRDITANSDAAAMLSAAIIVDTSNLSKSRGVATVEDNKQLTRMLALAKSRIASPTALLETLEAKRCDLSSLTATQKLKKDHKEFNAAAGKISFSSVQQPLMEMASSTPDWAKSLAEFVEDSNCYCGVVMCTSKSGSGNDATMHRELAVLAETDELCTVLLDACQPVSDYVSIAPGVVQGTRTWAMRIVKLTNHLASRKKLSPLMVSALKDRALVDAESSPACAETDG